MVSYPECRKGHFLRRWTEWPTWVWIYRETISAGFYHFSGCRFSKALHPSTSPKAAPQYFEDTPWPVLSKCWDWQAFFCSCCDQSMNTSSEPRYSSLSVERSSSALIQHSCNIPAPPCGCTQKLSVLFQHLNSLRDPDYLSLLGNLPY